MKKIVDQTGFFVGGVDSRNDPAYLGQTNYAWGLNGINRGGIFSTRPGFSEACVTPVPGLLTDANTPQGLTIFTPLNDQPYMVVAHGGKIYVSRFPFGTWKQLPLSFRSYQPVIFEVGIKSASTQTDGTLTFEPNPYPVLIIQDGITRAASWDGVKAEHTAKIPVATSMSWSGSRMWFGLGTRVRAGNLADPLAITEENITAEGGFFTLPGPITGMGQTPDLRSLLVFTDETTTSFQSSIFDRTTWRLTADFQKILFLNIGCVSHKSIINQYGLTWWFSHGGIVSLDNALQTYRTSRIHYRDNGMMRSKANLSRDLSRVCAGRYENFIFWSVPSGDRHNNHTWVMDQTTLEVSEQGETEKASWSGIWTGTRPVGFVSGVIGGRNRCFALSRDYATSANYKVGIWEMFNQQRADCQLDGTVKRITSGFEGRMMAFGADPRKITAVELDVSGLVGLVNVRLYVIGRRTGTYFKVGEKQIVATEGLTTFTGTFGDYVSQRRVIRSEEILMGSGELTTVQSPYIPSIDRGFSVYAEWDGQMRLHAMRLFADPQDERQIGVSEMNETTDNIVSFDGKEFKLDTGPTPSVAHMQESAFVDAFSSRYVEPFYSTR